MSSPGRSLTLLCLRSVLAVLAVRQRGLRAVPHLHPLPGEPLPGGGGARTGVQRMTWPGKKAVPSCQQKSGRGVGRAALGALGGTSTDRVHGHGPGRRELTARFLRAAPTPSVWLWRWTVCSCTLHLPFLLAPEALQAHPGTSRPAGPTSRSPVLARGTVSGRGPRRQAHGQAPGVTLAPSFPASAPPSSPGCISSREPCHRGAQAPWPWGVGHGLSAAVAALDDVSHQAGFTPPG